MRAGQHGQADHGVSVDTNEATGLAHATALLDVVQDTNRFVLAEPGVEEGCAFAFAEAQLASATSQHATLFAGAVPEADAEVFQATLAVLKAVGILAAELREVIHKATVPWRNTGAAIDCPLPPA
jgi:hypothetical protein